MHPQIKRIKAQELCVVLASCSSIMTFVLYNPTLWFGSCSRSCRCTSRWHL